MEILKSFPDPPNTIPGSNSTGDASLFVTDFTLILQKPSSIPVYPNESRLIFDNLSNLDNSQLIKLQSSQKLDFIINKYRLEFSQKSSQDSFVITNKTLKPLSFQIHCDFVGQLDIQINTTTGKLIGKETSISIDLQVKYGNIQEAKFMIVVQFQGGNRHFLIGHYKPDEEIRRDVIFPGYPYQVSFNLAYLRSLLFQLNGLCAPKIFAKTVDPVEISFMQDQLKNRRKIDSNNPHVFAECIKAELLNFSLLSNISATDLEAIASPSDAWKIVSEQDNQVLFWTIDLLLSVAVKENYNGMNVNAISNSFAPILQKSREITLQIDSIGKFLALAVEYRSMQLHNSQ